jgi:hypothetical protein
MATGKVKVFAMTIFTPFKAAFKFQLFHFQYKSSDLSKGCVTNSVCDNILCGHRQRDAEG